MPRKRRRTAKADEAARNAPSKWRRQHGDFTEPQRISDPETGTPVSVRRAVDTLGTMLANGTITPDMHNAGESFRIAFRAAALDSLKAMPILRVPGGTGDPLTERQAAARERVARAMDVLGGNDTAAGSCMWHVVGCECSIREWAARQGWAGRTMGHTQAQGVLVAALGVLAAHYQRVQRQRGAIRTTPRAA